MSSIAYISDFNTSSTFNVTGPAHGSGGIPPVIWTIRNVCIGMWVIIMAFGILGNIITIRVLHSKRLGISSTSLYLIAVAVMDILYLVLSIGFNLFNIAYFFPYTDLRSINSVFCHLVPIVNYSISYISVWLLVAVTVDRMVWVVLPFHAKNICTQRNALITIVVMVIFFLTIDLHFFVSLSYAKVQQQQPIINNNISSINIASTTTPTITTTVAFKNSSNPPVPTMSSYQCIPNNFGIIYLQYVDMFLMGILPCCVMLVANTLIILKLRKMRLIRERHISQQSTATNRTPSPGDSFNDRYANNLESSQRLLRNSSIVVVGTTPVDTVAEYQPGDGGVDHSQVTTAIKTKHQLQNKKKKSASTKSSKIVSKTSSLTTMLLSVNIFFMVSITPMLIYNIIDFMVGLKKWVDKNESVRGPWIFATEKTVYTLWYLNFSVHFLLYCMSGPKFRVQALKMCGLGRLISPSATAKGAATASQCELATSRPRACAKKSFNNNNIAIHHHHGDHCADPEPNENIELIACEHGESCEA